MNELDELLDKLFAEVDHLGRMTDGPDPGRAQLDLALASAKRVRRQSTLVVKALAAERDERDSL